MQVVININENLYKRFLCMGMEGLNVEDRIEIGKAIRKGTPLPKNHGRLIDADKVALDEIGFFSIGDYMKMVRILTTGAPTVVEESK